MLRNPCSSLYIVRGLCVRSKVEGVYWTIRAPGEEFWKQNLKSLLKQLDFYFWLDLPFLEEQ